MAIKREGQEHSMVHLNNNLMCAVDLETTGLHPGVHEIIHLALLPLNSQFEWHKDKPLLDMHMKPDKIMSIENDALTVSKSQLAEILQTGIPQDAAETMFDQWFKKLNLGHERRIVLLGFNNIGFDNLFLKEWLGHKMYETYFFPHSRDVQVIASYLNDVADAKQNSIPFPKGFSLSQIALRVGVEMDNTRSHDALYDAACAAKVYKKLLYHYLLSGVL